MSSLVKAVEVSLTLLDEARLELRVAVSRHVNLKLPALAFDRLRGLTVARVAGVLAFWRVLFIAEMMGHLALQGTLYNGFRELLQQTLVAEHVVGRLIVFEQFV